MKVIAESSVAQIEKHLLRLGRGNHEDNMARVRELRYHYLVELTEDEFFGLVFLENDATRSLRGLDGNRTLQSVASGAQWAGDRNLGPNWDLAALRTRTAEAIGESTELEMLELLLIDSRPGEAMWGRWYLQDGSHRALGYAITILDQIVQYTPQRAFLATNLSIPLYA